MHLQCQTRCQVGTGGLLSQKSKFEINASRFGATYVGASKIISMQVGVGKVDGYSPFIFQLQEAYPILIGDLDPSGNLQANIIHAPSGKRGNGSLCANHSFVIQRTKTKSFFTDNLRTKMMVAIMEGKWQNVQMTADYKVQNENKCLCAFPQLFAYRVETTQPP